MDAPRKSRFNLQEIGEADKHNLSATFLDAVQRFFDDPVNRERFKAWREQRKSRVSAAST